MLTLNFRLRPFLSGTRLLVTALGFLALLFVLAGQGSGETHTVDDDGEADFSTIQEAIDAAKDGDLISVAEGIYNGNLVIHKRLDINGAGPQTTLLQWNSSKENGILVLEENVSLSGFSLAYNGSSYDSVGLKFTAANGSAFNLAVSFCRLGILLEETRDCLLTGVECFNNSWAGIRIVDSSLCQLVESSFHHNGEGIDLNGAENCVLEANRCFDNFFDGITQMSSGGNRLLANNCSRNGDDGIYLYYEHDTVLEGNQCWDNENGIFLSQSAKLQLANGSCGNNQGYGIKTSSGTSVVIDNYRVENNSNHGIFIHSGSQNVVRNCRLQKNKAYGIYVYYYYRLDSTATLHNNEFHDNTAGDTETESSYEDPYYDENYEPYPPDELCYFFGVGLVITIVVLLFYFISEGKKSALRRPPVYYHYPPGHWPSYYPPAYQPYYPPPYPSAYPGPYAGNAPYQEKPPREEPKEGVVKEEAGVENMNVETEEKQGRLERKKPDN